MARMLSGNQSLFKRHRAVKRSVVSLLTYLPVAVLALASAAPAIAQAANITPSNFQLLYTAVESRGIHLPLPGYVVDKVRMAVDDDPFCCRQVIVQDHHIASFLYRSHEYLVLLPHSGNDHWLFLINDAGNSPVTLDAIVTHGSNSPTWNALAPSEAQPLVAAEEAFWLQWVDGPHF